MGKALSWQVFQNYQKMKIHESKVLWIFKISANSFLSFLKFFIWLVHILGKVFNIKRLICKFRILFSKTKSERRENLITVILLLEIELNKLVVWFLLDMRLDSLIVLKIWNLAKFIIFIKFATDCIVIPFLESTKYLDCVV